MESEEWFKQGEETQEGSEPPNRSKASECVSQRRNSQWRAQSTDDQDVMDGSEEVRTGRGSAGVVRGTEDRSHTDETSRKGKDNGSKVRAWKERRIRKQRSSAEHEDGRRRKKTSGPEWRLTWGRWLTPQSMSDPERRMRWADCEDEEGKEKEEQETGGEIEEEEAEGEKETGQEGMTSENPSPG